MSATTQYWARTAYDELNHHPLLTTVLATGLSAGASLMGPQEKALTLLAKACRGCRLPWLRSRLEARLRAQVQALDWNSLNWQSITGDATPQPVIPKAIILKPPVSEQERGVIYITFERFFSRFIRCEQRAAIARQYDVVLGPTWSPPHDLPLMLFSKMWPGRVYTLMSNLEDAASFRAMGSNLHPIPLLASSWVNPVMYTPWLNLPKEHDIVMLANFSTYKRHWLFFHTLRTLPKTFKVLLMGTPLPGRTEEVLREEARLFGVQDRFELRRGLTDSQIAENLARAKVSVIFSRQEGSCIAVVESMLANTPVAVFENARVGSKAFINDRTGRLLRGHQVAEQLIDFVNHSHLYSPRQWALENVACEQSLKVLNQTLQEQARTQGLPWTVDLVPFFQNDMLFYLRPEDVARMAQHYAAFQRDFGLTLGNPAQQAAANS